MSTMINLSYKELEGIAKGEKPLETLIEKANKIYVDRKNYEKYKRFMRELND